MSKCECDDRYMCQPCSKAWDARYRGKDEAAAAVVREAVRWLHWPTDDRDGESDLVTAIARYEGACRK